MKNLMKRINFIVIGVIILFSNCFCVSAGVLIYENHLESFFSDEAQVPIMMYHKVSTKDFSDRWSISPEEFEKDLIYIKENGFNTIVMSDLIDFVHKGKALPKRPIMLTFDDGEKGVYQYVYPLLEKYNMKAVISIIGKVTDEYSANDPEQIKNDPHLKWYQINEMLESGCIELQNHSYDLHKSIGAKRRGGESKQEYTIRLSKDLYKLQDRILEETKHTPTTFVYPFGAVSKDSDDVVKEIGFSSTLGCYNIVNKVKVSDKSCLFSLGRIIRLHNVSSEKIFSPFLDLE